MAGAGAASTSSSARAAGTPGNENCESHLEKYSIQENVPLGVLYAVGLTETGRKGRLHPYALNIEGTSVVLGSRQEALQAFVAARKQGKKLIDLGCMQVNHYYHRKNFASLEAMLDPETNIQYAARFLRRLKQDHGNWTMAVALYHASPRNKKAQRRYVCAVIGNLVATGFGAWTDESLKFCGKKVRIR